MRTFVISFLILFCNCAWAQVAPVNNTNELAKNFIRGNAFAMVLDTIAEPEAYSLRIVEYVDQSADTTDYSLCDYSTVKIRIRDEKKIAAWTKTGKEQSYLFSPTSTGVFGKLEKGKYNYDDPQWDLSKKDFFSPNTKSLNVQRRALRVVFTGKNGEDKGLLLFGAKGNAVVFVSDEAYDIEKRQKNFEVYTQRIEQEKKDRVEGLLGELGEHRSHVFGSHVFLHVVGTPVEYDEGNYPELSAPLMKYQVFASNVKHEEIPKVSWSSYLYSKAEVIEVIDSVEVVPFFALGAQMTGYSGADVLLGVNGVDSEVEKNYMANREMRSGNWKMIPESEWMDMARLIAGNCYSYDLSAPGIQQSTRTQYVDGGMREVKVDGVLEFPSGGYAPEIHYTLTYLDTSTYRLNNGQIIDVLFDERPEMVWEFGGEYLSCDAQELISYVTVWGNQQVAGKLASDEADEEYEAQRKEEERKRLEREKKLADIAKKYGQKYVDAYNELNIIVGMPEVLAADLIGAFYIVKNKSNYSSSSVYQCQSRFNSYSGLFVTISRGRVTAISTY